MSGGGWVGGSGGRGGGRGSFLGFQGECERRIEVWGKFTKKKFGCRGSGGGSVGGIGWVGGQDGCECNVGGRGVMWGMGDVNQE